uniref:Uncharacterized protein n=1 Tax=Candidatus Methanogaster sp. ANME-2c ERB4 TaxID=2759911 RepID=A0A7G9YI91_9EURY|nr:hypothetical protein LDJELIEA_00023 [Methanosarcinales archaeon ANME-2c ERB4]
MYHYIFRQCSKCLNNQCVIKSVNPAIVVIRDCVTVIIDIQSPYDSRVWVHVADGLPANVDLINETTSKSMILQESRIENLLLRRGGSSGARVPPCRYRYRPPARRIHKRACDQVKSTI